MKRASLPFVWAFGLIVGVTSLARAEGLPVSSGYVTWDATSKTATGAMGSAYQSPDTKQYIGCQLNASSTGGVTAACFAKDSTGNGTLCTSTATGIIQAIQAITPDAIVNFQVLGSTCIAVDVAVSSQAPIK